ncbi:MAG: ATP-grasp domain-containing protein [Planctomycetaceae bacterium]
MSPSTLENGLKKPSRILVAEFLLANSDSSRPAARSILDEAEAMLRAVVTDIAKLPDVDVTVLLSAEATALFVESPICCAPDGRSNIRIQRGDIRPDTWPTILRPQSHQAALDAVLLIAPECDGVLVSLLKAVQVSDAWPMLSLNLNWRLAEIFADKRMTDVWLRQHGIATIPTRTIDLTTADLLRGTLPQDSIRQSVTRTDGSTDDQLAVLKPRDGAGADSVRIVRIDHRLFQELPQQASDNDRWMLQPCMPGIACSVGFIGGGERGPTMILPPARQNIRVNDGEVSYHGGQIPCEPAIASRIAPMAEKIAVALGSFNGYLGADLLVDPAVPEDSEGSVRVVEVNPRLCTSYVGYQAFAEDNLAVWILQQNNGNAIRWRPGAVTFSANGEIHFTSTPTV